MTEREGVDATELRERLPDVWRIESGKECVYGFADARAPAGVVGSGTIPACFCVRKDGDLWAATWKDPLEPGSRIGDVSERVTGAKERCVEWVVEQAEASEGAGRE